MRTLLCTFALGNGLLWCLLAGLACLLWPEASTVSLLCSLTGLVLCLLPTTLTLLWSCWGLRQSPDQQLNTVLGGTGIRLFFVLGGGLALTSLLPYFQEHQQTLWFWIAVFYAATLASEMILLVRLQKDGDASPQRGVTQE